MDYEDVIGGDSAGREDCIDFHGLRSPAFDACPPRVNGRGKVPRGAGELDDTRYPGDSSDGLLTTARGGSTSGEAGSPAVAQGVDLPRASRERVRPAGGLLERPGGRVHADLVQGGAAQPTEQNAPTGSNPGFGRAPGFDRSYIGMTQAVKPAIASPGRRADGPVKPPGPFRGRSRSGLVPAAHASPGSLPPEPGPGRRRECLPETRRGIAEDLPILEGHCRRVPARRGPVGAAPNRRGGGPGGVRGPPRGGAPFSAGPSSGRSS